ncbi:hypothetical protein EVAR_71038_1 [Eumeta japonica]|uniref:Uncharacterized protein n=1 Tax=Eumeta variegata TaxID=151549 RepID=A0A4C2ADD7_EUMVA|nr:hypothetical protein EVAR_71038_1 [Eumeta japonica]
MSRLSTCPRNPGAGLVLVSCNTLTFCYRGIEAYREPRSGDGVPNLQGVIPKKTLCQPWLAYSAANGGSSGAVVYQQTFHEFPERVVDVKLRHDAHLSASSHLFVMPDLWKARAQKAS